VTMETNQNINTPAVGIVAWEGAGVAAKRKITIEVEVPEGANIGEERLERIARAILFEVASQDLAKLLKPSNDEVEELVRRVRRGLRSPHQ
jgi:hypothetical protein